jgi:nitroimidazol reductase NimA-like FMN-containing flavoprotein (pyridoxamine 5'-phosphate oxidase superfamily)
MSDSTERSRMSDEQLDELARAVIDSNSYMALGTADESGRPWVSPVWFASDDYRQFHWVSSPEAQHSRNLAARPEVAIAIYDSSRIPGTAEAVYMTGRAEELTGDELDRGIEVFGRVSRKDIDRVWSLSDVQPPSLFRLYRATASEHFVLIRGRDPERGSGVDRREPVSL